MKRKVFSSFVFAALLGAGMVSVTSCADYDNDINALQQQIDNQTTVHNALQTQINGLDAQIKSLQDALNAMKSCQCGDVDQKIADEIAKALAGKNYTTPEDVAKAISDALAGLNTGLTAEEVQNLIDTYHAAHPGCQCGDIQALIEKYLKDNPGLTEADVEAIVKAYHDAHPSSSLTENDVKSIVETYINQLQHYTKEQIEDMINTAITQALAGYVQKADLNAEVEKYMKDHPGLTKEEVEALIKDKTLTTDEVTAIATSVIEKYMKDHPYTLDTAAVENICNTVINNSQVINNLQSSITALQSAVNQVKTDLQNLKDNVYTKSEVENLINTLIAQAISGLTPNGTLSAEQQTIVNNLINQAINNYNAAHPDCNCQYDAAAFQALVDAVAANTSAIQGLQPAGDYVTNTQLQQAIEAVKALIPATPDLSNYVTVATYNQAIIDLNQAIANADAKAQQALDKANANGIAINNLQTTVTELGDLYISLSAKLDETTHKAEVALNRALSNYFEIETLKSLYNQLKNKLDIVEAQGYDDTEIKDHLSTLETQLEGLATKAELEAQLTTVQGLVDDAKAYADGVAATAAAGALNDAKEYTNQEIGKVRDDFKAADDALQGQIDDINSKLTEINETLEGLQDQIDELTNKFNALAHLITNVELQGSVNPAFGYYSLPVGITSNVLIAYYGKNEHQTFFPSIEDMDLVYAEPENWITEEDAERIGMPFFTISGGTTIVNGESNAGKLYLTLNPSNVDFTGTQLKLVNSLGEESPVTLGALKKSEDKLTFGQTRATSTFFYEAPATVTSDKVGAASFYFDSQLTEALEDVVKNKLGANVSDLAQAVYNQFNGRLDAYAVQASWTDYNGEHTVTSNYNIAATAIKPLSYNALAGIGFKLPKITPLSELDINLNDYIKIPKFDFTFDGIDVEKFKDDFKIKVHFGDIWISKNAETDDYGVTHAAGSIWTNVYMDQYVSSDGDIDKSPDHKHEGKFCLVDADGTFGGDIYDFEGGTNPGVYAGLTPAQRQAINAMIALIVEDRAQVWSAQLQEGFQNQMIGKITDLVGDINGMIDKVSEKLEGNLTGKLKDMVESANKKLNSALGKGDKIIGQLNKVIDQVNDLLGNGNPNSRLQSQVFYPDASGFIHPMSTVKATPTVVSGDGEGIELTLSSYTGEILAPSYKKFVAVTNVYRGTENADSDAELMAALKAANGVEGFNEVMSGDHYAAVFHPTLKDATYEIVYSSLDFFGRISQRKYYVRVK